jgi:dihydrofolate synthase / folylpolyglutamate synthase
MTYDETLAYLYEQLPMFQRVGASAYRASLDNIIALCGALGNPQFRFPSIHVAGTNGKGSTSHTLAAILQAEGYKTGLYTSPHLKSFRERIKINKDEVSEAFVVSFVERIRTAMEHIQPSFFEITVAMAFEYFSQEKVDIAVIEVGMGGRLDATNVIMPLVSVITNISFDHQQFLGDTLPKIAFEKAGIIKTHIPVVISEKQAETTPVFEQVAQNENSPLYFAQEEYSVNIVDEERFILNIEKNNIPFLEKIQPALKGKYQTKNLFGILKAIDLLKEKGWEISNESIRKGIENVISLNGLKGRWQILQYNPLVICDTAHNEAGISEVIHQIKNTPHRALHLVIGFTQDKDVRKVLNLFPRQAKYYFCQYDAPRALKVENLQEYAQELGFQGIAFASVNLALSAAKENAKPEDLIFVGGSTFIVAEIENL